MRFIVAHGYRAAVQGHRVADDREAQPRTSGVARAPFVHTVETLENALQMALVLDAAPGVGEGHARRAVFVPVGALDDLRPDAYLDPFAGVGDDVVGEVAVSTGTIPISTIIFHP